MAPEHSGFIEEYPLIRVDKFTGTLSKLPEWLSTSAREDLPSFASHYSPPHIQLLSHPHTDHLVGLSSLSQHSAPIYCSETTKRLLLALERKEDRIRFDEGKITTRKRPYRHLRRTEKECNALNAQTGIHALTPWDLLIPLPFDKPIQIQYNANTKIRLTLLPANHMPGSTMFLIEGPRGAVLHTGDLRAEQNFVQDLIAKTHLGRLSIVPSPFMSSPTWPMNVISPSIQSQGIAKSPSDCGSDSKLESVYLDTERIMDSQEPLPRSKAINDVLELIKLYPTSTSFHIDLWTSGYEQFCVGLYKAFAAEEEGLIHIDRYKAELFEIMANGEAEFASLADMVHQDKQKCGRFCISDNPSCIQREGVIRIKPHESICVEKWQEKRLELIEQIKQARKGKIEFPTELPLPIQRHSPLPELYKMIASLRPRHLIANTATPTARFISARMSENIGLAGAGEAEERQRNSTRKSNAEDAEEDDRKWQEFSKVWQSTEVEDPTSIESRKLTQAEAFFERVSRFRTILYGQKKMDSERLLLECLDAASDEFPHDPLPPASASVLCPSSSRDNVQQNPLSTRKAKIWEAPGKYASVNASPFMTAAMREARSSSTTTSNTPIRVSSADQNNVPTLTTELASRYLAYAAMYLGWKIRNPSHYRQEMAWRAIRKVKPVLAKQTEEALQKELGWAIPPWDEVSFSSISIQPNVTETSIATQAPPTPSTPCPLPSHTIAQSISPLELGRGAKALQSQLAREAESQQSLFSDDLESSQGDGMNDNQEEIQLERLESPPCAQRYQRTQHTIHLTLSQLRETVQCLRTGNVLPAFRAIGHSCFDSIIDEWLTANKAPSFSQSRRGRSPSIDGERMRCQLDLIGVAAKSQRARRLLGWDSVDLRKAHYALRAIFEEHPGISSPSLHIAVPHAKRAKIVLRYLQPHLT
ncbi:uncharacterized protein FA14DRAFT_190064 [Meira miltonrushii]|uniref:DNA repair metallo-beta-lactamase domain-containing protein n=1 Tax=Meira miltonrushii TaxID=1280837 RepID=A0A316VJF0_9BASI|nr:uncharacterized protein FA14DRAFT_190064 [Meira miltonrushii]PWN36151.1 hypothetical protein FA14DRAFT_190064 [Meira miltonrushii]